MTSSSGETVSNTYANIRQAVLDKDVPIPIASCSPFMSYMPPHLVKRQLEQVLEPACPSTRDLIDGIGILLDGLRRVDTPLMFLTQDFVIAFKKRTRRGHLPINTAGPFLMAYEALVHSTVVPDVGSSASAPSLNVVIEHMSIAGDVEESNINVSILKHVAGLGSHLPEAESKRRRISLVAPPERESIREALLHLERMSSAAVAVAGPYADTVEAHSRLLLGDLVGLSAARLARYHNIVTVQTLLAALEPEEFSSVCAFIADLP